MKDSVIRNKSKVFALNIIALYKSLSEEKREFVLSKHILRSGTSIGANVAEASNVQSDADFLAKMYIALKETGETQYWLELLFESDYIDKSRFDQLNGVCYELVKLLTPRQKH